MCFGSGTVYSTKPKPLRPFPRAAYELTFVNAMVHLTTSPCGDLLEIDVKGVVWKCNVKGKRKILYQESGSLRASPLTREETTKV